MHPAYPLLFMMFVVWFLSTTGLANLGEPLQSFIILTFPYLMGATFIGAVYGTIANFFSDLPQRDKDITRNETWRDEIIEPIKS